MMICGIDEAGRGPIAGPVSVAGVILPEDFPIQILNDSKALSEKKREEAAAIIYKKALYVSHIFIDEATIDKINILQATMFGMEQVYLDLVAKGAKIDLVLVDGNKRPSIACETQAIVKGDAKIVQIMAASIIAKTMRDSYMKEMALKYPQWQFEKHKGYPTKLHRELCAKYGLSPIHRKSFTIKL